MRAAATEYRTEQDFERGVYCRSQCKGRAKCAKCLKIFALIEILFVFWANGPFCFGLALVSGFFAELYLETQWAFFVE